MKLLSKEQHRRKVKRRSELYIRIIESAPYTKIYASCSWNPETRQGRFWGGLYDGDSTAFVNGIDNDSTVDQGCLKGVLWCVEQARPNQTIQVVLATVQSFKFHRESVANKELKQEILSIAASKQITLKWEFALGKSDHVRSKAIGGSGEECGTPVSTTGGQCLVHASNAATAEQPPF